MTSKPSTIGRYELLTEIGRGGMGTLYRAWDPKLDRQIAIKLLNQDNEELRERFAREARSAARLRHPHIVTVFDVGEDAGRPYIAMEYIQGQTLAELIRARASISTRRKIELAEALCEGLAHAHHAGIVHRDIKPANVMLDANGDLKILDFGIARLAASEGMTRAGMLIGTLSYMAPEQVSGKVADHRADIFAVGALLYELLSYQQAFPGGLDDGLLHRLLQCDPEPLETLCSGIDPELTRIVNRCLEKKPEKRYPDLAPMIEDLQRVMVRLASSPTQATDITEQSEPRPGRPRSTPAPTPDASRKTADREELARRRQSQIERYLDQAQKAIASGDYESGIAACEEILLRDAENSQALDLLERAKTALDVRQADEWLGEAERELQRGALTAALALIDRAAALDPASVRATQLRRTVEDALREREQLRQRAEAIRRVLQRAHHEFDQGRFNEAAAAAEEALELDASLPEAIALKAQAADAIKAHEREEFERRARESVREARRIFGTGSHDSAIDLLARFEPQSTVVSQALEQLRAEAVRIAEQRRLEAERRARQQRLAAQLVLVRGEIGRQEYADALQRLEALSEDDRRSPEVQGLIRDAETGQAEVERLEQIARDVAEHVARAAGLFARNDLTAALARVDAALALDAGHSAALALRRKIEDARRVIADRRKVEERLAREREAKIADSLQLAAQASSHEEAIVALNDVLELDPDHSHARALLERRREALLQEQSDRRRRLEAEKARREQPQPFVDEEALTIAPGELRVTQEAIDTGQTLGPHDAYTMAPELSDAGLLSDDDAHAAAGRIEPTTNESSSAGSSVTAAAMGTGVSVSAGEMGALTAPRDPVNAPPPSAAPWPASTGLGATKKIPVPVMGAAAAAVLVLILVAYFQLRGSAPAPQPASAPPTAETQRASVPPSEPAVPVPTPPPAPAAVPDADRPASADAGSSLAGAEALTTALAGVTRERNAALALGPAVRGSGAYAAAVAKEREASQLARTGNPEAAATAFREATALYRKAAAEGKAAASSATPPPAGPTSAAPARGSANSSTSDVPAAPAANAAPSGTSPSTSVPASPASQAAGGQAPPVNASPPGAPPVSPNPPSGTAAPTSGAPSNASAPANVPASAPAQQSVPPPVTLPPPPASPTPASEEPAIRTVIAAYAAGFSSLDADAVKRVFPSVDDQSLKQRFSALRSQRVVIQGTQITISGNSATVSGTVETVSIGRVGGQQRDSRPVQFRLQKANGTWTIVERR